MLNGGGELRFWEDAAYAYDMFSGYGIPDEDIYLLNYDGNSPDGTNPGDIIDGAATQENLESACQELQGKIDADDLLLFWSTDHGRGYYGPIQRYSSELVYHGYLDGLASVDPTDEMDYAESEFKLRALFTGGSRHKGNHGMNLWRVYYNWYSPDRIYYYRLKYVSHFQDVYFEDIGIASDNDIYIEQYIDYLRGDYNKNGIIEPGEVIDYDGDSNEPHDPAADIYDEDDWGYIDKYIDDLRYINTQVPDGFQGTYHILDYNLDGTLDLDLDHDPGNPEVNATDIDNNGLFDGVDVNDDKDMNDWVSIDEKICLYMGDLTDDQIRAYLNSLHPEVSVIMLMSCFSGGFIEDLSQPDSVVFAPCEEETPSFGNVFFRNITSALSGAYCPGSYGNPADADSNSDGNIDMAETFNFSAANDYGPSLEIPQYDDNADGISHEYPIPIGGDGPLGAVVTLNSWEAPGEPPTLDPIGDKQVDEGDTLSFEVTASDPIGDPVTITVSALESWMAFDGAQFTAAPSYNDRGRYGITFTASDGILTDSETIMLTVNNVNRAPILNTIENQTGQEGTLLQFDLTGYDPDGNAIRFSLINKPIGASLTNNLDNTATFRWIPGYMKAGSYDVICNLKDYGQPRLTSSQAFTIIVNDTPVSVTVSSPDRDAREDGLEPGKFVIKRTENGSGKELRVNYKMLGSAINGVDYEPLDGIVIIPAGELEAQIMLKPIDDDLPEEKEWATLYIKNNNIYNIEGPRYASVRIYDND